MVCAACRKPRARSVNCSISMLRVPTVRRPAARRPFNQATATSAFGKVSGTRHTSPQGGCRMRIEYLYRYPVKGLTAEAMETTEVEPGRCIPWDRAFALAQGDSGFDPAAPAWLMKDNFMCLKRNAKAAALFSFFDPRRGMLAIRAPDGSAVVQNALTEEGRERIGAFLNDYMGE